jgi:hypothetical protein
MAAGLLHLYRMAPSLLTSAITIMTHPSSHPYPEQMALEGCEALCEADLGEGLEGVRLVYHTAHTLPEAMKVSGGVLVAHMNRRACVVASVLTWVRVEVHRTRHSWKHPVGTYMLLRRRMARH